MFDDRRKYLRFDIPLGVEYRKYHDTKGYVRATTSNFSREGIGLIADDPDVKVNSTLELKVQHPTQDDPVAVLADVVWKKQADNKWQTGLKMREIDKAAKIEILECAYDKWTEKVRNNKS